MSIKKAAAGLAVGTFAIGAAALGFHSSGSPLIPGKAANPQPTVQQLCTPNYTDTVRPSSSYTSALKIRQLKQYGFTDQNPADYEEDHLISLEIGGDPKSPDNLWPEPWAEARKKDQDENRLHDAVCSGKLTPKQAQDQIVKLWPAHKS